MWSRGSAPLRVDLTPSRGLAAALGSAHAGAGLCLVLSAVPAWAVAVGLVALAASAVRAVRRHALLSDPGAVTGVACADGRRCRLRLAGGEVLEAERLADPLVHPWVVVLRFRPAGRRRQRAVVITRDMLPGDEHRRLRVALNLERLPPAP